MKKMAIVHHSADVDGNMSGYLLKLIYPDADIYGYNYEKYNPLKLAGWQTGYDIVVFGDITPHIDWLKDVISENTKIDIYDHHPDALQKIADLHRPNVTIHGVIGKNLSGAGIIFDVFEKDLIRICGNYCIDSLRNIVEIISKYDTWTFDKNYIFDVNLYIGINEYLFGFDFQEFSNIIRQMVFQHNLSTIQMQTYGDHQCRKLKVEAQKTIANGVHGTVKFAGRSAKALLIFKYPDFFVQEAIKSLNIDMVLSATLKADGISFSVRSRDESPITAAEYARSFDGNGHAHAAGFKTGITFGATIINIFKLQ